MIRIAFIASLVVGASEVSRSPETVGRPPAPPVNWNPVAHAEPVTGPPRATAKERGAADAYAKALSGATFDKLGPVLDEDAHFSFA